MFHTKLLSIIVVCVFLLCYCTSTIICSSLQTVVIGSGVSSSHQTTSLSRHVQESTATTYSNDGGNTQNNGTNDNGMWQYYGSQQVGVNSRSEKTYPYSLYFEKSVIVFTNWARMSPVGFIARFNSSITAGISLASSGLAPLFEHFNLEESSRYHSYDMAINNCFQHPSCITNEDTFVRIKTFYSVSASMAENIAAGQTTPLSVTIAWINSSGHRANIINSAYTIIGAGYFPGYSNSSYGHYWTQNFASGSHGISNPIVAGTHFQITTGQLTFLANYYHTYDLKNSRKLQAFTLYLEDQPYTMTLPSTNQYSDSSVSLMGTYEYTLAANTTTSAGCRKYYFKAVDASGTAFYYPSYGYLLTQGENKGCTTSYSNQQRSSQNAVASNVNKSTSFSPLLFITLHIFLLISYLLISYP